MEFRGKGKLPGKIWRGCKMPEYRYAKGRIAESLQFISGEMQEFEKEYSVKTPEEFRDIDKNE